MIYWFFGYPGIGKDYCARELSLIGKFPHVDADDFLTEEDRKKLLTHKFTSQDRMLKLTRIVDHIKNMQKHHHDIAVADSLPDNISREFILRSFNIDIRLILVTAPPEIHKKRLAKRKNHFFTENLLDIYIRKNWQEIKVPHKEFVNDKGEDWNLRLAQLM